jgi:hypothetical protein
MVLLFLGLRSIRKATLLFFISMITIVSGMAQSFPLGTDVTISSNATYSGAGLWGSYTLTVKSGSSLTFTSGISLENSYKIIVEPGAKLIVITGGVAIKSTASLVSQGSVSVRAGGLMTQETATLSLTGINKDTIIGGAQFNGTSNVNIGAGTDVYIGGNVTVQSSAVKVDGTLAINGNLNLSWGQNTVFTGDGDVTTTGSMNNINSGSMFGTAPFACNTGPCSGRNFCNYANTITSSTTIAACGGASFTISANTPPTGTPAYLWQSTTTIGSGWVSAAGTNNTANYTASGLVTTTYYRRRIVRDGCTSYSKVVTVTATEPAEPMVIGNLFCSGTRAVLTALGSAGSYQWYTSATGATAIAGANKENYTTPVLTASTTYYVSSVVGSCESATRKAVTATLLAPPAVTPSARCGGGTVTLAASGTGGTYQWYDASNNAIYGATNATYTTGWIGSTTTYYVSSKYGSCETAKVAVTASILSNGFAGPAITTNSPACLGGTLTLSAATISGATSYTWTGPGGFTATGQNVSRTNMTAAMAGAYKVKAIMGSCTSAEVSANVTTTTGPTITATTPASRCGAGTVTLAATASAGTVNWYTVSTGGTAVATGAGYSPFVSATTTFYVDATNNGCTTASRTAVIATLNPVPTVFVDNAAPTICSGTSVTLKASGDPGKTLSFTGNEYIQLDNDPLASATSFTFEAMIYWTDNSTQWQRFFDFGNNTNVNMFFTPKSSSGYARYAITTTGSGGEQQINTTTNITTNTWHHVAITYNAATTTGVMYINGVAVGANTAMTMDPTDLTLKPLAFNYFGKSQYGVDPNFAGQMDEIRIWDIARTSAQLNANRGISVDPNSEDLVAYYKLNEGSGNELTSVSGGGTATVSGSPAWVASTAPVTAPAGLTTTYAWSPSTGLNTASGATVTASPAANQTYTVTATYSNGCSSTATSVITVNAAPTIASTTPASRCGSGAAAMTLSATASAGTIKWYTVLTGGTSVATGTSYSPTVSATTTYYVDATNNGCTTPSRTAITATVTAIPTIASTTPSGRCGSGSITLGATASAGTINWYTVSTGGTSVATGTSYSPTVSVTTTYYVDATNNSCTTPTRTAITATVTAIPTVASTTPASRCGTGTITLGATASAGTINWYTVSTGGTSVATGPSYSTTISETTTYYVDATNNSCTTSSRTAVVATVNSCTITWTGATSNAWNTNTNWSSSSVPTTIDDVIIPASVTSNRMPVISAGSDVRSVSNSGTITMTSSGILNVYGNISSTGTFTTVSGSAVAFNGNTAQTVNGVSALHNVKMNNTGGGVSLSSALTVNGTLSLTRGVLTTNSKLTINFDNGGNIAYTGSELGSISGTVSGRRDLIKRTHYIAAPFSGSTSEQVQATTPLYQNTYWRMFTKDFAAQNWTAVTTVTAPMPLGTGFSLTLAAPAPLILSGTYNHTATFTGPDYSNAAAGKYLLVGNPYPSTLDWNNAGGWTKTNVGGAIYFWDPANSRVASYVGGLGTNGGTQYIPAMQSFLVTTTGTGGSSRVSINNAARSAQSTSYFRIAEDEVVRVRLTSRTDSTRSDETVIRFNELATNAFDYDLDALKIFNTGGMPSVYTTSPEDSYSVNSYTSIDSAKYIPVATKLVLDGSYTLQVSGSNPNVEYILVDKLLGTSQSIDKDSSYAFTGLKSDDVNRFELQLRVSEIAIPTGVHSSNKSAGLSIYSSTKGFVIKTGRYAGDEAEIEILDMTGNSVEVLSGMSLSSGSTYVPLDLADGAYLVKVRVDGTVFAAMIALVK